MPTLGPTELIIILIIVILLFGVGRISKIAGELGSGIRAFKEGIQSEEQEDPEKSSQEPPQEKEQQVEEA